MTHETIRKRPWQVVWTFVAAAVVPLAGCSAPAVEGLQLQEPPGGFFFDANADRGLLVLPDRMVLSQGAWWGDIRSEQPESDIFVTRYRGSATLAEAQAARDRQASRWGNPTSIDYGAVMSVTIDGRPSWAWLETRFDEHGLVRSLDYTAVIPYDSVTYAVEFGTSAEHRLDPDSVVQVVHSFGQGTTAIHWNMIVGGSLVLVGLLVFLAGRARGPRHVTAYRLANIASDADAPNPHPRNPSKETE